MLFDIPAHVVCCLATYSELFFTAAAGLSKVLN
uniref:Uncharacterized protein n=1 Tax=Arundo donax TaxID=35708 RepID=A0A0A9EKP8_ARUDO